MIKTDSHSHGAGKSKVREASQQSGNSLCCPLKVEFSPEKSVFAFKTFG